MTIYADQLKGLHLTVDAHVVVQLGEELISDVEQALLELVKNSYDADSKFCSIVIDTSYTEDKGDPATVDGESVEQSADGGESETETPKKEQYFGLIRVTDGGHGMSLADIQRGWLVVSASSKRAAKDSFKVRTKKLNRIPIGDKGLGRLSTMKLGDKVRIKTFTENEPNGIQISFRWSDFRSGMPIEDVRLEKSVIPKEGMTEGTILEIIGLSDVEAWREPTRRHTLRKNLSSLVHPFQPADTFSVTLALDTASDQIERWTDSQLKLSAAEFSADWEQHHVSPELPGPNPPSRLHLAAKVRLNLFSATPNKKSREKALKYIVADRGVRFSEYIKTHKETRGYKFFHDPQDGSFSYNEGLGIEDIPTHKEFSFWSSPGGFSSKIYYFMLKDFEDSPADKAIQIGDISKERIKEQAGVSVFRDGFRIRLGGDWIGLSKEVTSGGSFYSMRPSNVLGYVNIDGNRNAGLVETSNREGFIDNPQYRGFMTLMRRFTKFSNGVLEALRRAALDFCEAESGVSKEVLTPEEGVARLSKTAGRVTAIQKNFASFTESTSIRLIELQSKTKDVATDLLTDEKTSALINRLTDELQELHGALVEENKKIQEATAEIEAEAEAARQISKQFDMLHEQIARLYESASIGLAAQGMAHDISSHIDEINSAVKRIRATVRQDACGYKSVNLLCATIEASTRSISSYLSVIDPMLPAARTRRDVVKLADFVQNYFKNRSDQVAREEICVSLLHPQRSPTIRVHPGRLLQTFDNLVRNSSYWLAVAARNSSLVKEIYVEFFPWGFSLWDSGRGVREPIEENLFELFVSDKPENERSGLGLFISRALMEAEGNKLYLAPERNTFNRRYKFNLDVSSSIQKS